MALTADRIETIEPGYAPFDSHYAHARPWHRWIVGVDLGQSQDPTAVAVLQHRIQPTDRWAVFEQDAAPALKKQIASERFDVRHLQRLPLGLSYPEQVALVGQLLARPPLNEGAALVIDETGVGRAVGDIFEHAGLQPERVTITAGNDATSPGLRRHSVPKGILISNLDARMHRGELRIAQELLEASALREELKDFRRKVTAAGRFTFEARVGKHDDLVLAVSIALWWALRPGLPHLTIQSAW